jgi:ankyrin repeat protein
VLTTAVSNKNIETVRILLEAGADVDAKDRIGNSPLMEAVEDYDILQLLIDADADVNAKNKIGKKPKERRNVIKDRGWMKRWDKRLQLHYRPNLMRKVTGDLLRPQLKRKVTGDLFIEDFR